MSNPLRDLPSVGQLLESPRLKELVERVSHNVVLQRARGVLDDLRRQLRESAGPLPETDELAEEIARRVQDEDRPPLRPAINATGILLHTGLGRAPLAEAAIDAMTAMARDYASVEVDLDSGKRSQRVWAVEGLLRELTGAEAAAVVNNNAAATMLALAALAHDKEAIVSRGQLIEIGGSFRLPDVMATSGAVLREVGTTNKTRLSDYEGAINERTGALMRVHTSNFRVMGFTAEVSLEELVELGRRRNLPVIDDIGSGAGVDFAPFGFPDEPIACKSIEAGADVVLFSGDKLLGGPQCGILVGKRDPIARIAKHPMMRALRVDKITLAALAATLRLYRDDARAKAEVPLLQRLSESLESLRRRAGDLAERLEKLPAVQSAEAIDDVTYLGGGSIPTQQLSTACVAVTPSGMSVDALARSLRLGEPALVGRVQQERLLLDLRSVPPRLDAAILTALANVPAAEEQPQSAPATPTASGGR